MARAKVYGMSGGPYEDLREGWALVSLGRFSWQGIPHFWKRIDLTNRYVSLCGLRGEVARTITGQKAIFHPGDFLAGRCDKCSVKRSKQVSGRR